MDSLQSFREQDHESGGDDEDTGIPRVLLLFRYGKNVHAIDALRVDAIISWRDPARLPASVPPVAGVVQDRGRIITVLQNPLGRPAPLDGSYRQLVVCSTARGLLGLPAEDTDDIAEIVLATAPDPGETVDSSVGPVVYVDPTALLACIGGSGK